MFRFILRCTPTARRPMAAELLERRQLLAWGDWPLHIDQDVAVSEFPGLLGNSATTIVDIDTGINLAHPVFSGRIHSASQDFANPGTSAQDEQGHGTMTAAIAIA